MIRPRAALRRAFGDDEFLLPARGLASGGDGRARLRAGARRDRDRRPQHARGRGARACVRAREQGGARRHAGRSRSAAVFDDGTPDLLAYPKDRAAYGRLCRILTAGNLRAPKGECRLRVEDLLEHGEGLQVVALPPTSSPPLRGGPGRGVARTFQRSASNPNHRARRDPRPSLPKGGGGASRSPSSATPSAGGSGSARASPTARTCAGRSPDA